MDLTRSSPLSGHLDPGDSVGDHFEGRGSVRRWEVDDAEVEASGCELLRLPGESLRVGRVQMEVGRRHDLARIATERGAVLGDDTLQPDVLRRRTADVVPVLGHPGDRAEGALLTAAADADRRVRPLDG